MAKLGTYWKKRDFGKTAEPRGKASGKTGGKKASATSSRSTTPRGCITICGSSSTA